MTSVSRARFCFTLLSQDIADFIRFPLLELPAIRAAGLKHLRRSVTIELFAPLSCESRGVDYSESIPVARQRDGSRRSVLYSNIRKSEGIAIPQIKRTAGWIVDANSDCAV